MKRKNGLLVFFTLIFLLTQTACSKSTDFYFRGLKNLEAGKLKKSEADFLKVTRSKNDFFENLAWERLCGMDSSYGRIYFEKIPCETSLLMYCRHLSEKKDFRRIEAITRDIDILEADNELVFLKFNAILNTGIDGGFYSDFFKWISERNFSDFHAKFSETCREFFKDDIFFENKIRPAIDLKMCVKNREWGKAYGIAKNILSVQSFINSKLLSDAGKSFLFGSKEFSENADFFRNLEKSYSKNDLFYIYFYTARMMEKNSKSAEAIEFMEKAFLVAETPFKNDNALWYLLKFNFDASPENAYAVLEKHMENIKDPYYYDDFFETVSNTLLSTKKYAEFAKYNEIIQKCATADTKSMFAYITASLAQAELLKTEEDTEKLYRICLEQSTDMYYRLLAAEKLKLRKDEIRSVMLNYGRKAEIDCNPDAEILIEGLIKFHLPDQIFDTVQKYSLNLTSECILKASKYLYRCGQNEAKYIPQSLRLASRKSLALETSLFPDMLELLFPKNYMPEISEYAAEYKMNEYTMLALIRSESFFDEKIFSHVGAAGLTQLMEATAGDVAKKLKMSEYNLLDADTNIRFGTFYLSELNTRLKKDKYPRGTGLYAFISYNAGITKVRRWLKTAPGLMLTNPDLFLETVPYSESRGYGKNLTSASMVYAFLYYDKMPSEVLAEIL